MRLVSEEQIALTLQKALSEGLVTEYDSSLVFQDFDVLKDRVQRLIDTFPPGTHHAVAVKTNPLISVLSYLEKLGVGSEAASFQELELARFAGVPVDKIVFDSPAKTAHEIHQLIECFPKIRVNCDSLAELARYPENQDSIKLGLRINPLISSSTVEYMNVGGAKSKFGEPICNQEQIIAACLRSSALDCLHVHIGSQISDFEPAYKALDSFVNLAGVINQAAGHQKITTLNIGGGFPVNYFAEQDPLLLEEYVEGLRIRVPQLFDGTYSLITEFGRYVHANACWCATRVEYVKTAGEMTNLITHLGADMFLRECYNPGDWHHDMFLLDGTGRPKNGVTTKCAIAGPLCFGGDFVNRSVDLPDPKPGDWLVIRDVGANTFSLWSRHCSRPFPQVIASGDGKGLRTIKKRETSEAIIAFWS